MASARWLVDANVLSEPIKPGPDGRVVDWLRRRQSKLAVDPVVLGEIRFRILLLDEGRRRQRLERWFDEGIRGLRCLDWDATTGLRGARLLADLRRRGRTMPRLQGFRPMEPAASESARGRPS